MSEPVRLAVKTPHEEIGEVIVPILEDLLERAKRGELESFLVLFETTESDDMFWKTAGSLCRSRTIGRIEILKARLLHEMLSEEGES